METIQTFIPTIITMAMLAMVLGFIKKLGSIGYDSSPSYEEEIDDQSFSEEEPDLPHEIICAYCGSKLSSDHQRCWFCNAPIRPKRKEVILR